MGRFGSDVRLWKPKGLELIQTNENAVNGSLVSYILISLQLCKRIGGFVNPQELLTQVVCLQIHFTAHRRVCKS